MNKTSVITSVAVLISLAHYCSPAAAAADSSHSDEDRVTLGRTRFSLHRMILPAIPALKDPAKNKSVDTALTVTKAAGAIAVAPAAISTAISAGPQVLGASMVNPAVGLATAAAIGACSSPRWSAYRDNPCATPQLQTWRLMPANENYIHTLSRVFDWDGNPSRLSTHSTILWKEYRDNVTAPGVSCSWGSLGIEGREDLDGAPSRKICGRIAVRIECNDEPGDSDRGIPKLVISKCHGGCYKNSYCDTTCGIDFQTCRSPEGFNFETFTLNSKGNRIALGFTNGAIGILTKIDDGEDRNPLGWVDDYETREGKEIDRILTEHRQDLRQSSNRSTASNVLAAALVPALLKAAPKVLEIIQGLLK